MLLTWHGQSCFRFQGDTSSLVTDPYGTDIGLKLPRLSADIVTISHDHFDHNNSAAVKGAGENTEPFTISDPGEYEIKKTFVYGIPSFHDAENGAKRGRNVMYRIEMDGISFGHLGDLGHELTNGQIESLEGIDVLLVPVGGIYTLDGKQAAAVVNQLEPRLVIPMHYKIPGLKLSGQMVQDLENFCKEIGICPKETTPKLKLTKKELPQEDMQVIIMTP